MSYDNGFEISSSYGAVRFAPNQKERFRVTHQCRRLGARAKEYIVENIMELKVGEPSGNDLFHATLDCKACRISFQFQFKAEANLLEIKTLILRHGYSFTPTSV